jgi:hypothetical protein
MAAGALTPLPFGGTEGMALTLKALLPDRDVEALPLPIGEATSVRLPIG